MSHAALSVTYTWFRALTTYHTTYQPYLPTNHYLTILTQYNNTMHGMKWNWYVFACKVEIHKTLFPFIVPKKSITNHGDLLTWKLCIAFDNMSYVGYNNRSFMYYTAIQMILILHDSGVLCKLHILDHELDHFSCPVLLHDQ